MAEHTKGPWSFNDIHLIHGPAIKFAGEIWEPAIAQTLVHAGHLLPEESHANAARIVACVNALEGYNPDAVRDVVEALRDLACFGDKGANDYLALKDSYAAFDEPNAVSVARAALRRLEGDAS